MVADIDPQTVIFLHIPKTGGSTLRSIIWKRSPPQSLYQIKAPDYNYQKSIDAFKALPENRKRKIRALIGHMGFGLHEFFPQPATYITILREPIDRALSFYYFARLKARPDDNSTLNDFLHRGGSKQLNNGQTRMLSSLHGKYPDEVDYGKCSDKMLKKAKSNLQKHFLIFGLTEYFDQSVLLFRRKLGWTLPFYIRRRVNRKRSQPPMLAKDTLVTLREYNQYDIELYNFARKLFKEQINQYDNSFQRELKMFRFLNHLYGKTYSFARMIKRIFYG